MRYETLLWDLDHTLLDSEASEALAFDSALADAGIEKPSRFLASYIDINRELWAGVERGETTPDEIKLVRFQRLVSEAGLDADPSVLAEAFVVGLGEHGELFDGALSVLEELARRCRLALVTNGLRSVQRRRIARLDLGRFFDVVAISSEVGAAKPGVEIFENVFAELGSPSPEKALMIGDSLTSDVRGGNNFGLDTCWYNPNGLVNDGTVEVSHEVRDLRDVVTIAFEEPR